MSVNFEVKGQLAKLLATEDLIVEHRPVETAMFNVQSRVLTLPMWKKASESVFDMLVAHEVGHALFTPDDWSFEGKIPQQFVNITEDARIEKLMKRKYAGLSKTFFRGYNELADEDFFCLENEDISKMNLADRTNLWFKISNFVDIPIEDGEEREIIDMIGSAETFADAVLAAEYLYKYCKAKQNNADQPQQQSSGQSNNSDNEGMTYEEMMEEADRREDANETDGSENADLKETGGGSTNQDASDPLSENEPNAKTVDSLSDAIKDLVDLSAMENVYLEFPELNLDTVVISNKEVHDYCVDFWKPYFDSNSDCFDYVDSSYTKFKKSAQKEVNYLVKEFECKKAADSYARSTTARTGVLDCSKLHTYKYNEDLFKKVTTLADGKNHGLVFVLDWSGSMSPILESTIKQLYNLIWFCSKVNIPFDVYSFTNDWHVVTYDEKDRPVLPPAHYAAKDNQLVVEDSFSMVNILTSRVSKKELESQMKNIYRVVFSLRRYLNYDTPIRMGLSGTPLNEALVSLRNIIPKFKKDNSLQKGQCVVLTDGEAAPMSYHSTFKNFWDPEPVMRTRRMTANAIIRDRRTGSTYKVDSQHSCAFVSFTNCIINNLKDNYPDTNFIGIRLLETGSSGSFIRTYASNFSQVEKYRAIWKKSKSIVFSSEDNTGYDTYFGLSGSDLVNDDSFVVNPSATKSQIKNAFVKSLKTKKFNKKVLNEFVSLIV